MCRLFALHAGADPVSATFWLLDAPDSLREQSHREPDGAGIGVFDPKGRPVIDKQPIAAWEDAEFAREARVARSRTFVAHVRYASTGAHTAGNTHPFAQDGRLFAHNGAFGGLDRIDRRLDEFGLRSLVGGQTDSERMFALITAEARRNGGDVTAAITAALTWISDSLPVFAVNLLLATPGELWALRYPETHELYILERPGTPEHLEVRSPRIRTHSRELSGAPSVIVASEPMDGETGWRLLDVGELVHVGADLAVTSSQPLPPAPRHPLTLADLSPTAAASQGAAAQKTH
ncbi:class II glutamine amidotransferase [Nakamurella sp. GG22]